MVSICICTDRWLEMCHGDTDRIIKFAKNLSKNGTNVYLVDRSRKKSLSALFLDEDKYYNVKNSRLTECQYPFFIKFLLAGLVKLFQEILNKWLSILTRTPGGEVTIFNAIDPYLIAKLFFVCKKEGVGLIQCEFPTTAFSSFTVKKVLCIPLIYDSHNIEYERLRSIPNISKLYIALTKQLEIICCRLCDLVFAVSEEDREQLRYLNVPNDKIKLIPNSVEIDKYSPVIDGSKIREKYGLNGKIVFIFHGTLPYQPNREAINILLNNILPGILKKYPFAHLLLVGKDPPNISHPNVIVTGFVENLPEHIAAADIALVPLLSGGGTRIKILEYTACGKAVVSTIKGSEGLRLQNGRDILTSKHPDSEFINLVFKLIEDFNLRKTIGANARIKTELFYDWEKNARKAIGIYDDLKRMYEKKQ